MGNIVTNTTVQVCTKNLENARNIKLSTNTHRLILCRAMMNDVYDTITNTVDNEYGDQQDKILKAFRIAYFNLDIEVCTLIGQFIEETSLNGINDKGAFFEM